MAINIALIPPEDVMKKVIDINKHLLKRHEQKIALGKKKYLPHITLAMAGIESDKLMEVVEAVKSVTKHFQPIKLTASRIDLKGGYSALEVDSNNEIHLLHRTIMKVLERFAKRNITQDMFLSPVEEIHLDYVTNFKARVSYDNYWPHITLGYGMPEGVEIPFEFTAARIAICHIGKSCTCQKVLFEFELDGNK